MTVIDRFEGKYAFLSNFYRSELRWTSTQGFTAGAFLAATVEHAFQAEKASNASDYVRVLTASSPSLAKRIGRTIRLRPTWQDDKFNVMHMALRAKFLDHFDLALALVDTGDAQLVEGNSWHDNIWGNCFCSRAACQGEGLNHLGRLLMQVRTELQLQLQLREEN